MAENLTEKPLVDFRLDSKGDKYFFGVHYDLATAKKLYKEEEWDEEEVMDVEYCYVHHGIVWIDDERRSGWTIKWDKPKSMKWYKECTHLLFQKDIDLTNHINTTSPDSGKEARK